MSIEITRATHAGFVDFIVHTPTGSDRRTAHLSGLRRTKAQFADLRPPFTDLRPPFTDLDESDVDALIAAITAEMDRHAEKLADLRAERAMGWQA